MQPVSIELKSWIELIEKILIVVVLLVTIITSGVKTVEFLTKKTELQVTKNEAFKAVVRSHEELIRGLNAQISGLDAELSSLSITNKLWGSKERVREFKAADRRILVILHSRALLNLDESSHQIESK